MARAILFDGTERRAGHIPLACLIKQASARLPEDHFSVRCWFNETGVVTSEFMVRHYLPWLVQHARNLVPNASVRVVFDSASGHKAKATVDALKKKASVQVW